MINLGDPQTKKLTTGRLFFKKTGESNYRDMGNCDQHKSDFKVTRKEHMRASGGFKRVDLSLASEITPMYSYVFDEHTEQMEELKLLGTQGADAVQAGGVVAGEALTGGAHSKQGRTYFTANLGLSGVTVKVGGVAKTLDVDYAIDLGSGAVTILNGGGIADDSAVTIDYTAAAVTQNTFTSFDDLLLQGDFRYIETDQFSIVPREVTEFTGQAYVSNWGDNSGDYNKITLECIPLTNPTVRTRQD